MCIRDRFNDQFKTPNPGWMHIFLAKIADTTAGAAHWLAHHDRGELTDLIRDNRRGRGHDGARGQP
eukprot:2083078-Lingulodinium_polyedra.AAC.1